MVDRLPCAEILIATHIFLCEGLALPLSYLPLLYRLRTISSTVGWPAELGFIGTTTTGQNYHLPGVGAGRPLEVPPLTIHACTTRGAVGWSWSVRADHQRLLQLRQLRQLSTLPARNQSPAAL